ncbi:unnamed protein product [Thlaspi arvense]|uniref:Two-component response regulator n=1 Tax=Thlaspi arvense TaxID=13288 RepID=A0AAU9SGQ9_THLAR|nr:unnamed protein product [Thlaspi arvense]
MSVALEDILTKDSRDLLRKEELSHDDEIYEDSKEFPTTNIRVLLVDADPKSSSVMKNLMAQFSYQVTIFENGDEAISFLVNSKHEIDLVIWDFHMPDIDGVEALNTIGKEMDLPVVITSHDHKKETVMKSTKNGACDFLVKPVSREVIAVLWRHVYHKGMSKSGLDSVESYPEDLYQSNEEGSKNVEDSGEQNTSDQKGDKSLTKKPRMTWTPELHQKFEKAVEKMGSLDSAVPKQILKCMQEEMNVEGLTRNNVASHLQRLRWQKYRLNNEKNPSVPKETREDSGWRNAVQNITLTAAKPLLNQSLNLHNRVPYFTNHQAAANAPLQYPTTNYVTMNNRHFMNNPYYVDPFPQPQQLQQPQYYQPSPQIPSVTTKPEPAYVSSAMENSGGLVYPPDLPYNYGEHLLSDYSNFDLS